MTIHDRTAPTAAESDCSTVFVAIELRRTSWVVALAGLAGRTAGSGRL